MSAGKAFLILHGKQAMNEDVRAAVEQQRAGGRELTVRLTWEAGTRSVWWAKRLRPVTSS